MLDVVILAVVTIVIVIVLRMVFRIRQQDRRMKGDIELCEKNSDNHFCNISQKLNVHPPSERGGVLAISLFGKLDNPDLYAKYVQPVIKNADELAKGYLPNWHIRLYIAPSTAALFAPGTTTTIMRTFLDHDCEVFVMERDPKDFEASMWRFLAANDDARFVCMDADFSLEEPTMTNFHSFKKNIEKWLCSGKKFFQRALNHINILIPISAGMWGGIGKSIPDIKERIEKYCANWFGCDEAFLTKEVYPLFQTCGVYRAGAHLEILMFVLYMVGLFVFLNVIVWMIAKQF